MSLFREAIHQYGMPSRIRCDNGGENTQVCQYMDEYHGFGRGSAIRGRSVHNQRIERIWLDMWNGCINVFYDLFSAFEKDGLLNHNSEEQVFALHYIFIPRIQHALDMFIRQWNHHKIRTENSLSPLQLFVERSLQLHSSSNTALREMFSAASSNETSAASVDEEAGSDGNHASDDDEQGEDSGFSYVDVPATIPPLTDAPMDDLVSLIDPMSDINATDLGLSLYLRVLDFLSQQNQWV